jgi:hypothetical protein
MESLMDIFDEVSNDEVGTGVAVCELDTIAERINEFADAAGKSCADAVVSAAKCGSELLKAKAAMKHGQWLPWLESNCRVKKVQATKYMRLAKEMPELLESNVHFGEHLPSINHAVAMLGQRKKADGTACAKGVKRATQEHTDDSSLESELKQAIASIEQERASFAKEKATIEAKRRILDRATANHKYPHPLEENEYKLVRGVLHPDNFQRMGITDADFLNRVQKAFDIICKLGELK